MSWFETYLKFIAGMGLAGLMGGVVLWPMLSLLGWVVGK